MKKLLVFLSILLLSCSKGWYIDFVQNSTNSINIDEIESSFSLDDIKYIDGLSIRHTPDLELLDTMVDIVDLAESRVYLETYIFTEKRIREALIRAKNRWVDVRVILEKNIYLAWNLNASAYKDLTNAGIPVVYNNPENFSLNHTKMMIVDDEVIISTWNYSYSTYSTNREFFLFIYDDDLIDIFISIFTTDFELKKVWYDFWNLVLSPDTSRIKLEYLLKNADKSIKIYAHNFSDDGLENIILKKRSSGVDIEMIFPTLERVSSNWSIISRLVSSGVTLSIQSSPFPHAKAILIDSKYLYIWSINYSSASMDRNREVWLLIKNKDIINYFLEVFNLDFPND